MKLEQSRRTGNSFSVWMVENGENPARTGGRARVQVRPSAWKRLLTSELPNLTTDRLRVATCGSAPFGVTSPLQEPTEANASSRSESVVRKVLERTGTFAGPPPNETAAAESKFGKETRTSRFGSAQSHIF